MRNPSFLPGLVLGAVAMLAACNQHAHRPETASDGHPGERERAAAVAAVAGAHMQEKFAIAPSAQMAAQARIAPPAPPPVGVMPADQDRENYAALDRNPIHRVAEAPVSTFSVDVDTGSYSNVRRYLSQGRLPPRDAVRVEEMINYFDYRYDAPRERGQPFAVTTEIAPTPWNAHTHLLHVGIQGWKPEVRPVGTNLVFLVDVSGSMHGADKLPLVKTALKMLLAELGPRDRISLVVYAGASGVVLEPTPGDQHATIAAALDRLEAGGSTNGGEGIQLAYAMARQGWIEGGVNRVLLTTDGDFNVGVTRFESLLDLVRQQRSSGIALTTLGFGQDNYNDHLMEQLADAGDGNHAYIDSAQEAHKVLVRQREATLTTIARDVKIQIEFNPAQVAEYRLIGYENRMLAREDFNNDAVDAGDIGSGHTVTALYEIALQGSAGQSVDPLRYAPSGKIQSRGDELAHLRLRYKQPQDGADAASQLIEKTLLARDIKTELAQGSEALRLSAAVAAFGQLLSGGVHLKGFDYTAVERLSEGLGEDEHGDRAGFRQLVRLAGALTGRAMNAPEAKIGG